MSITTPDSTTASVPLDDAALDQLFREARTAHAFTGEPVSDAQLEQLYELVSLGPTAANSQPLRIVFVRSEEAKARLAPHLSSGNRDKTLGAPVVAILGVDVDFHERLPEVFPHNPGAKDWYPDRDARRGHGALSAGLQIGYVISAVRALGLAAGPMTGFDRAGVDGEFFAGTAVESLVLVNIGHPAQDAFRPRLPRLSFEDAVTVL